VCQFCVDKIKEVDYKDLGRLRRFLSERGKIEPRRKTGTCAAHQRSLNVALKRARQLALLPFTAEHIRVTGVLVREPGAPPFRGGRGPRPEVEGAETTEAPEPEPTTDGQAPAPSTDSPETVASLPSVEGVRETPATGPTAQEA
jgi:small subunit ribosomal protein S18